MASLLALSRAEQDNAKKQFQWRLSFRLGTVALSLIALAAKDPLSYLLAIGAICAEAGAWLCGHHGSVLHGRAERARRLAMLTTALGTGASDLNGAELRASFSTRAHRDADKWEDAHYWASAGNGSAQGPALLRLNLRESAFWTWHLYEAAAGRAAKILAALTVSILFLCWSSSPSTQAQRVRRLHG